MISARYAAATAVLLAMALVPTVLHTYRGAVAPDGLTTAAIDPVLQGMPSTATARKAAWVKNTLESDDWIERIYRVDGQEATLFVGRSYDAKRLYHHPELALLRGIETEPAGVARTTARPNVPLHLLRTARDGREGIGAYALLYDGRFIENPIAFQLRTSAALLVSAPRPMTLFLASDLSGDLSTLDDAPATRLLLAAIRSFESQRPREVPSKP